MILLILMTVFGLGRCLDQLPTKLEIESSINRTIEQVERMIDQDEKLPKLSREQIVDILFNITSQDIDSMEESVRQARSDYQRALLVVLPYNSKDAKNEDIKDLYTKPPMVQVIPDSEGMLPFSSIQEETPVFDNFINTKYVEEINNEFGSMQDQGKGSNPERFSLISDDWEIEATKPTKNKQKVAVVYGTKGTEKPTTRMLKTTSEPQAVTVPSTKSTVNVLTSDQWRYFAPPVTPKVTTSTTTTTTTTTQRPTTTTKRPTTTTKRPTTTTQRPTTTTTKKPITTTTKSTVITKESYKSWEPFLPTALSSNLTEERPSAIPPFKKLPPTTVNPEIIAFDMTNHQMEMEMMKDEPQPSVFVTPMSSQSVGENKKLTASYSASEEDSKAAIPMRKEVMTLLKSIGLDASETKLNNPENYNPSAAQGIFATNFEIPESDSILKQMSAIGVDSPTIASQNTFEKTPKDVRQGFNNLTPDVQWMFQRFGLNGLKDLNNPTTTTTTTTTTETPVRFRWNNFKPLPSSHVKDESMRDFLAKFGLGIDNRDRKSMKLDKTTERTTPSVIEAVPENMRDVLANIGLIERKYVPEKVKASARTDSEPKLHVFKPHEIQLSDHRQRIKINQLLDTVRLAQEGKAHVSDVRQAATELLETAKTLKEGPDPLNLEELMQMYSNEIRNEVKRQNNSSMSEGTPDTEEDSTTATSTTTTTSITTTTTTSTTTGSSETTGASGIPQDAELPSDSVGTSSDSSDTMTKVSPLTENPNIDDLADSFGGVTGSPDPVLPAPRKTGLYFLVDWNSFLEVGEEDKDKVNLRFAPKVGDRSRFIPVVIP